MATTSSATGQSVPIVTSSSNGSGTTVAVDLEIVKKVTNDKKFVKVFYIMAKRK